MMCCEKILQKWSNSATKTSDVVLKEASQGGFFVTGSSARGWRRS